MIKVGIIGADSPDAGELLRILIFHPEVEIVSLVVPSLPGHKVSSVHHGFIGENDLFFTDKIDISNVDIVFLMDDSPLSESIIENYGDQENLRIIDLSPSRFNNWMTSEFQYGLSEVNRKGMVRGARHAVVPSPIASATLIALFPLASHLLLSSDIDIYAKVPDEFKGSINTEEISKEIESQLKVAQNSFGGKINLHISYGGSRRCISVQTEMKCPLSAEEIANVYDSIYDDHNFAFYSVSNIQEAEVEGTQKCVISLSKPGAGLLNISAIVDGRLRGGAGDAVHILNLLFALHEKVGLNLKPCRYSHALTPDNQQSSKWFD